MTSFQDAPDKAMEDDKAMEARSMVTLQCYEQQNKELNYYVFNCHTNTNKFGNYLIQVLLRRLTENFDATFDAFVIIVEWANKLNAVL